MNNEVEAYPGELRKLRELTTKLKDIFIHSAPDKFQEVYFICGDSGDKDSLGLPEKILICPAYGLDYAVEYTKSSEGK